METVARQRLSRQEYLAIERDAEIRSEFLDGEMFAMAGGTRRQIRIARPQPQHSTKRLLRR